MEANKIQNSDTINSINISMFDFDLIKSRLN